MGLSELCIKRPVFATVLSLSVLLVGVVLGLGALVLLMPHRVELPARRTVLVAGSTAVVGTLAALGGFVLLRNRQTASV